MASNPYSTDPSSPYKINPNLTTSPLIDHTMSVGLPPNATNQPVDTAPPNPASLPTTVGPVPGNPTQSTGLGVNGGTFNNYTSPTFVQDLITSYGNRPGANPSVKNDPNYWIQAIQKNGGITNDSQRDYWTQRFMTPEGGAVGGGPGGAGPGAYVPGAGVPGQGSVFGGLNPQNPKVNVLEDEMAKIMAQAEQPVTPDDPIIKSQVEPYGAMEQQGVRNLLSSNAEKSGPNANPEAVTRSANEQASQATATFQGQAMQNELGARRQQLQQLLQDQSGLLTEEQKMQLEEELQQLGLAQNAYQFDQNNQNFNSPLNPNFVG